MAHLSVTPTHKLPDLHHPTGRGPPDAASGGATSPAYTSGVVFSVSKHSRYTLVLDDRTGEVVSLTETGTGADADRILSRQRYETSVVDALPEREHWG